MEIKEKKVWLITDTHFFHKNIAKLCGRPDDHTELILKNWRESVNDNDITIHMGDVIFGLEGGLKDMLDSVPGEKILIRGNHDKRKPDWYMRNGFIICLESLVYKGVLITHTPAQRLQNGCTLNVHGHYHNNDKEFWEYPTHHFNRLYAIENTNYMPVLFDEFVK